MSQKECPATEDQHKFLSGQLATERREEMELHLSLCHECRRLLIGAYEEAAPRAAASAAPRWLKARARKIPRKPGAGMPALVFGFRLQSVVAFAAMIVVAAGLALFSFINGSERPTALPDVLRQGETVASAPALLAPSAGDVVNSQELEFRWERTPGAILYAFTLMDEKGDILFQASASGQSLKLNAKEAKLERGNTYFWYVSAKSADGAGADSEIRKFVFE